MRLLIAALLFLLGGAITAFGVITLVYRDPPLTTAIILGAGLVLVGVSAWIVRR